MTWVQFLPCSYLQIALPSFYPSFPVISLLSYLQSMNKNPHFWFAVAPKRSKKDRDRTWEYEEKDRRGSGDHRRSFDSRRSSGGRYRERSPEDSDEDSPPPSLSDRKWPVIIDYIDNLDSFLAADMRIWDIKVWKLIFDFLQHQLPESWRKKKSRKRGKPTSPNWLWMVCLHFF